jgi:hypothetical protein
MPVPLTVEDGSMPPGANSYCGLAEADFALAARGKADWPPPPDSGEDPEAGKKAAALIRASDYLNGLHWTGTRAEGGRVMAWPRKGAASKDGWEVPEKAVPEAVRLACACLALLAYSGTDLQPVLDRGNSIASRQVDTISVSYFQGGPARDVYASAADLLYPYCSDFDGYSGTGGGGLVTAEAVI